MQQSNFLLAALAAADDANDWSDGEWGLAVRQARSANLLASLGARFTSVPTPSVRPPEMAAKHFQAARNVVQQRNASVLWECGKLRDALARVGITPVFLKGAGYVAASLPLAGHRHFADIDLMVPQDRIADAETCLMLSGWLCNNHDAYDQRYYRKWMHEIPPLQHIRRGTTLDLHHAIAPLTARYQARSCLLFQDAVPAAMLEGSLVLSPPDMVLHAATHLFSEGEADQALRNLVDISELLQHFQQQPGFSAELARRAFQVGLARPLYYAVRYIDKLMEGDALEELKRPLESASPGMAALRILDAMYLRVFQGNHPSVLGKGSWLARNALYLRGHWLRMPAHLLLPHLAHKFWRALGTK